MLPEHDDETVKAIHDGVDLTLKSFSDCFGRFNIMAVDPLGEPFDPAVHQAMTIQENPDVEPNTVIAVMQKGYTLHGRHQACHGSGKWSRCPGQLEEGEKRLTRRVARIKTAEYTGLDAELT